MLRREYQAHVQRMFELLASASQKTRTSGVGEAADRLARAVMDVETTIARATMDRVAFRDPRRRDNPTTMSELAAIAPNIDFPLYFRGTGAPDFSRLNVLNPQYLRDINAALDSLPLDSWKAYMKVAGAGRDGLLAHRTFRAGTVSIQRRDSERPEGNEATLDALQRRCRGAAWRRRARRTGRQDLRPAAVRR
jgi:predicted metalloendopeptidase